MTSLIGFLTAYMAHVSVKAVFELGADARHELVLSGERVPWIVTKALLRVKELPAEVLQVKQLIVARSDAHDVAAVLPGSSAVYFSLDKSAQLCPGL